MPAYRSQKPQAFPPEGNEFSEIGKHELPDSTVEYLRHGVPEGGRNNALRDAAHQCRDSGRLGAEWIERLVARGVADGLSENEARKTVESSTHPGEAREPCGPVYREPRMGVRRRQAPTMLYPAGLQGAEGFKAFLRSVFEPGEFVSISPADEEFQPGRGTTFERDALLEMIEKRKERKHGGDVRDFFSTKRGVYVRINPVTDKGCADRDVTAMRHVLAEIDNPEIPREEQLRTFVDSDLPISAIIDSAGKGLHAWVRVDATTRDEYNDRAQIVYETLKDSGIDPTVGNPSRYSRCPTASRGEGIQQLVRLGIGAEDWQTWHAKNDPLIECNLSTGKGPLDLSEMEIDESQTLLGERFLCRGGGMMWTGSTGIGKSSSATQQDILWAIGQPAFGILPNGELKTATLQIENDQGDLTEMMRGVFLGLQLSEDQKRRVNRNVRIFTVDVFGEDILRLARRLAMGYRGWKPDIIRLDPFQALSGLDVAGDVPGVLAFTFELTRIAKEYGVAFILNHHTPKLTEKSIEDRGLQYSSYLGAGGAQLANWARADLLLLPTLEEGIYQLIAGKRSGRLQWSTRKRFFKHSKVGICWEDCTPEEVKRVSEYKEKKPKKKAAKSVYRLEKEKGESDLLRMIVTRIRASGVAPSRREVKEWNIPNQPRNTARVLAIIKDAKAQFEAEEAKKNNELF